MPRTAGSGRPKGSPNKATANAREAIAAFVDGNAPRLAGWLDEIAADDPAAAFRCFMDVVEYHVPKLARTEISGDLTIRSLADELGALNKSAK